MSAKKWTLSFVGLIILAILLIMTLNYVVDPYKYFASQSGDYYDVDADDYLREQKIEHIKKNPDKYDAYLIGGSKAGAIKTENLSRIDGYKYYNCWLLSGNFPDYLAYAKYIVENTSAKKILLQISTSELYEFNRTEKGTIYETPAEITGKSKFAEYISFLMKNPKVSFETLLDNEPKYYNKPSGERDLKKYYDYYWENLAPQNFYFGYMKWLSQSYFKYMDKEVPEDPETVNACIDMLRQIKQLCDDHGVELQVFFGSLYSAQMVYYEGESFYDFLEQVVMTLDDDVWCFNTYNDVALCLYNYYNPAHYFYEVGDLMIDTMAGKKCEIEGFGIKLNRENVGAHIKERRKKLAEWKDYYKKNDMLPLNKMKGKWYLKKIYG